MPSTSAPRKLVEIKSDGEDYQSFELREHIYLIPDTYIGSDQQTERESWVFDFETQRGKQITHSLPQGMEKIYHEIVSNASDNVLRSAKELIKTESIDIRVTRHRVTVRNGGRPIPIRKNKHLNIYNPEMIFGRLLTGSNYVTDEERIVGGRNGYGAKLTNIFSILFQVEVGDPERKLHYVKVWHDNMTQSDPEIIKRNYTGEAFVEISYDVDFKRFGYDVEEGYPEEAFGLFARYAYDCSQNTRVLTRFVLDLEEEKEYVFEPFLSPRDYGSFYFGETASLVSYQWPKGAQVKSTRATGLQVSKDGHTLPSIMLILADTPMTGQCVSFVNGIMTIAGGVHVDAALKAATSVILSFLNGSPMKKKKDEEPRSSKLTWKDVKQHLSLLMVCHLPDPQFEGQMKEKLSKPVPKITLSKEFLEPVKDWYLVSHLREMQKRKLDRLMSASDGKKRKHIRTGKGRDANFAGKAKSSECFLFIVEGESAENYASILQGLIKGGPDYYGTLPLRGKPLNVLNAMAKDPSKVAQNKEIIEVKRFLALENGLDYHIEKNFKRLRYGGVIILSDADVDGTHIRGLIMTLFYTLAPTLLERKFVRFLRTPIVRLFKGKTVISFYTEAEYKLWTRDHSDEAMKAKARYYKGLGSSVKKDIIEDVKNQIFSRFSFDPSSEDKDYLELAFSKTNVNDRKEWIREWDLPLEELNIGDQEEVSVSDFVNKEFIVFAKSSLRRAVPSIMDGLKDVQRKVIWGAYLKSKKSKSESVKVAGLGAFVTEKLEYHHGDKSINDTIIKMAQSFVGSNNMSYLYEDGLFGSRVKGGEDASAARYISTRLIWWFPYVFKSEDMGLVELAEEDGKKIEPSHLLPILPMHLINGAHGVGTGFSTSIPPHNPLEISNWIKERLQGRSPSAPRPWYRGFTGSVEIKYARGDTSELSEDGEEKTPVGKSVITIGHFYHRNNALIVDELPVGLWTNRYKSWLEELVDEKVITEFSDQSDEERVLFFIHGFRNANTRALRLTKSYGLSNMILIDEKDRPVKYASVQEILEDFYQHRLPFFTKRKEKMMEKDEEEINRLEAKIKYIEAIREKRIDLKAEEEIIENKLRELGIPNYVRDLKTRALSLENVAKFQEKIDNFRREMAAREAKTAEDLWYDDLEAFEKAWLEAGNKKPIKAKGVVKRN